MAWPTGWASRVTSNLEQESLRGKEGQLSWWKQAWRSQQSRRQMDFFTQAAGQLAKEARSK